MSDMRDTIRNTFEGIGEFLGRFRVSQIDIAAHDVDAHDVIGIQPRKIEAVGLSAIEASLSGPEIYDPETPASIVDAAEAYILLPSSSNNVADAAVLEQQRLLRQSRQDSDDIYKSEPPRFREAA